MGVPARKLYNETDSVKYLNYIKAYIDLYVNASGTVTGLGTTVDKIQPGVVCLFLYEKTGQSKYLNAAINIKNYLLSTSPINFNKTPDGGYWHKNDGAMNNVMMVDGMYMLHPFLVRCGHVLNDPTLYDAATFQLLHMGIKAMPAPATLPKHAWDYTKSRVWANTTTGMSTDTWSRGTGWYMMALADVLEYLPTTHSNYAAILELFQRMSSGVAANQHVINANTSLWYQVVDKPLQSGNYDESSGSGMFVYALKKGVDHGWLDSATYLPVCRKGWAGMQTKIGTYTDGKPQIQGFCPATNVLNTTAAYTALLPVNCPVASGTQHPHGYCGILMATSSMEFPTVKVSSPTANASFTAPAAITINATAYDGVGSITKVEFYNGTTKIGEDLTSPYSFTWTGVGAGNYALSAKATNNASPAVPATSDSVGITVTAPTIVTFSRRIEADSNDVEEFSNGKMTRSSYAIEMNYYSSQVGNQAIGLRFNNVTIPAGATINQAYIQFGTSKINYSVANQTIRGEYAGNSAAFTMANNNVNARNLTTANATWTPAPWATVGEIGAPQKTPELKTIVQEIIGHPSWSAGNFMTFILNGTGARAAYSYEGDSQKAALLVIEYTP